jgi:hypothetical protein
LNRIYDIKDTLYYNMESSFCAVLLKKKSDFNAWVDKVDNTEKDKELKDFHFLLQIWSDQGLLVYEQKLMKPPLAWNMFKGEGSGHHFVFQELTEQSLNEEYTYLHLCSKSQTCSRFKFRVTLDSDEPDSKATQQRTL